MLLRKKCYQYNLFKVSAYANTRIIKIGNLNWGGTGKTPLVTFIATMLLENNNTVSIISRGYKRKTKGYVLADKMANYQTIGDEPMQQYLHFKNDKMLSVAVSEKREKAITNIISSKKIDTIILDDAYQQLGIKENLNLMLTTYDNLFYKDFVIPSGTLREFKSESKRAHIIVICKCPDTINETEKNNIKKNISYFSKNQKILFSSLVYGQLISIKDETILTLNKSIFYISFCGIANDKDFTTYLNINANCIAHFSFTDHYNYKDMDIANIKNKWETQNNKNSIIITTQKDMARLLLKHANFITKYPIYYLPVKPYFSKDDLAILKTSITTC